MIYLLMWDSIHWLLYSTCFPHKGIDASNPHGEGTDAYVFDGRDTDAYRFDGRGIGASSFGTSGLANL